MIISATDQKELADLATLLLSKWKDYNAHKCDCCCGDGGGLNKTVTTQSFIVTDKPYIYKVTAGDVAAHPTYVIITALNGVDFHVRRGGLFITQVGEGPNPKWARYIGGGIQLVQVGDVFFVDEELEITPYKLVQVKTIA